jgi:hypothetical protein
VRAVYTYREREKERERDVHQHGIYKRERERERERKGTERHTQTERNSAWSLWQRLRTATEHAPAATELEQICNSSEFLAMASHSRFAASCVCVCVLGMVLLEKIHPYRSESITPIQPYGDAI